MKDEGKTKRQLIDELVAARKRIAGLEATRSELESVEHALRDSEERFRIALQNSKIVVYNQDRDLRYTWIYNPLLGFTPEGILGKTDADLLLPEDAAPLEQIKRKVMESGSGSRETVRTIIDGESYFYDLTVEPLRDATGAIIGVTGASRDITERVRAEEALRESEEKHRTLFETMAQGVVYQAVNGEIMSANPAAERILGLTLDQMQGRTSMDPRWRAIYEDGTDFPGEMHPSMVTLRTGEAVRNVVMGVFDPQTEDTVWINVNATPEFRSGENTPYRVYTTFEDITRRWQAEKSLQEERDRAQGHLDIAGVIIVVIEPDQTVSLINKKGCEILGHVEQEILGANWFDICIPERERERVRLAFDQLMLGAIDPVEYFENAVLTRNGGERVIAWHNTVLRDEAGTVVGTLSSGEDITARKRAESERDAMLATLRQRTQELGERVKELKCLYGMSRLREKSGVSLEEILQGTVDLIPPAWQYPDITAARVIVDDQEFRTKNYREDAPYHLSADIAVHGQACGLVQVCYVESPRSGDPFQGMLQRTDDGDEDPFLVEERILLSAIAERLGRITEHMRAEQEYQTILITAIDSFWLCDTQGNILDVNDALCQMLGYTREELLTLTVSDLEAKEPPEEVARHIDRIVDRGHDRFESRLKGKDGRVIDVESSVSYMDAVGGRFFSFLRDITERKWAEEVLRRARDELELRVEERTLELHRGHQREQVLNSLLRLSMEDISLDEQLEMALDELLSIPWLPVQSQGGIFLVSEDSPSEPSVLELRAQRGLSHAAQVACTRVAFGQCLCGRAAASQDILFSERADDRHEIHYEGMEPHGHYCVPILSGDRSIGTIVLYLDPGHARDVQQEEFLRAVAHTLAGIIERKRVEDALRRSETGLADAQRIARLGNWDWDIGANRLHWSDEIYRIFGLAPQEFGATYEAFLNSVHPDDRSFVEQSVAAALSESKSYSIDHRIVLPDGSERVVHEQAEITYDPSGQPIRMVGTVQDITERKQAEVSLRQSEQQLRTLNEQLEDHRHKLEKRVAERTREIERRRQVAESLRDMLAVLNSDRPLDEILSYIVLVARRLLGSDTSAIYRLTGPDGAFEVQTVEGQHADLVSPLPFPPGYRQALQDGQPVAVSDAALAFPDSIATGAGGSALTEDLASHYPSLLAVPLTVGDEIYGGLVLYYSEPRVFSGEDVELAVAFADQAALAIENARLHKQAEVAAVLEERDRLARDLHDSVTQSLYSITLLAEGWKRLDKAGRLEDAEDPLGELGEIAQQALKEMRLLVHELRPPDLEEVGLLGALHQRLGAVEKRAGVDPRLVASDVVDLPPQMEECLYRIAIEALNNALKHASATEVTVTLQPAGEGVALAVRDNGCGFDTIRMEELRGVGLNSMRERAEGIGAELVIESEVGVGTNVQVIVATHGNF